MLKDKTSILQFENFNFNEKLDVLCEIVIRYDNETYFDEKIAKFTFDLKSYGFDIAKKIQNLKK